MLYDLLRVPPKPGTPLESLMLLVWQMRQTIRLQETRAIVQAIIAANSDDQGIQKALKESWDTFTDELMPYQRGNRKRQDQTAIDFLKQEAKRGPLKVIPLVPLHKPRSKLRKRFES